MLRSFQYEAEQIKETGDKMNQIHQILLHTESTKYSRPIQIQT